MINATAAYNEYLSRDVLFPKFKVYSFSLAVDSWEDIVTDQYTQTPVDLTPYVTKVDYSFDRISVAMVDEGSLLFHPDGGALRQTLRQGRVIRIKEGFEGLAESEWLWTFTGTIEGTYSWKYERPTAIDIQFAAFSRQNNQAWKRRNITSENFTVGSDWGAMFYNIVHDVMLMEDGEIDVPNPWHVTFDKNTNQVVNAPPWESMENLAFAALARPWFDGRGKLKLISTDQHRTTAVLPDDKYLMRYDARQASAETVNKVILVYLSNMLSRVDGEDQVLGTASVTTGFFRPSQDLDVYYSDERKTRSDNPRFIVKQSVNSGLLPVGDESMVKVDEFHSRITVSINVWVPILATTLLASYLLLSLVPDTVQVGISGTGITISVGRLLQAVALIGILIIMMSLGTGIYEVWGIPYEMVYLEKQAIAQKAGLEFWEEREKQIRNDFISTEEQALPLVENQLHYEVMREQPRTLLMRYDPRYEPGDIIELSSTVRVYVDQMQRTLTRGSADTNKMTIQGFKTVL